MNNVVPARAGELYKTYLIKKRSNIGFVSALGVLIVERLYDGFMMSLFFILSVFLVQDSDKDLNTLYQKITEADYLIFYK